MDNTKSQMDKVMGDYANTEEIKQKGGKISTLGTYSKKTVSDGVNNVSYDYTNPFPKGMEGGI